MSASLRSAKRSRLTKKRIRSLVVAEALFKRDRQNVIAQFHRTGGEDAWVHQDRPLRHQRLEIHFPEDVFLEIDAGRDFREL